jgi:hypothetical protein
MLQNECSGDIIHRLASDTYTLLAAGLRQCLPQLPHFFDTETDQTLLPSFVPGMGFAEHQQHDSSHRI